MIYRGSCHCGKVAFEVEGEIRGALACNCSICSKWLKPPIINQYKSIKTLRRRI